MAYFFLNLLKNYFAGKSISQVRKVGRFVGSLAYIFFFKRKKIIIKNCETIGVVSTPEFIKENFRHTFSSYFEMFFSDKDTDKFADEQINIVWKCVEKPDFASSPFIIATAHLGSWELSVGPIQRLLGIKTAAIGRKIKNEKADKIIREMRAFEGMEYILHRNAAEKINECLANGISIVALLDHSSTPKDSIFVPFFGQNTTFNKGMPTFSARKNVPILPIFFIRTEKGCDMVVYDLIYPDKSLKPKERIRKLAIDVNKVLEEIILDYPEQWYLIHKRFKRIENDEGTITNSFYR